MSSNCCSSGPVTMLLACSGASNVGQLTNQAAVELTREGVGKMFCLAGIGGRLSGFMQSAKDVDRLIVMDGCELGCAKATLDEAGVPVRGYLVVTDLGIEKNKDFDLNSEHLAKLKEAVRQRAQGGVTIGSSCCCADS